MSVELICVLRMALALALGFAIGFERKLRFKEAGIRTHTIVCVGACLYMIISKFGFQGADTSRVAAQIVSGIGFIGAGMIFYHKEAVHGLTTAAGIWATAAIGMAAGAGMYVISASATALIILVQCIMHLNLKVFKQKRYLKFKIVFVCKNGDEKETIKEMFSVKRFSKISAKKEGDDIVYSTVITSALEFNDKDIYSALSENEFIRSITREDDEF
ncbi:MAG: MgtC/SapB family protein [Clostridiales bacterium]|nr:MgtC/SapB family protein [Clostridiales bacterium]